MKVQKSVNTKTNETIVTVSGDTYQHRTQLGRRGLGFTWYGAKKMWYMPERRFNQNILSKLVALGADVSALQSSDAQQTPSETPGEPKTETPSSDTAMPETPPESAVSDKTSGEYGGKYDSVSYPINPNIFSKQIDVVFAGKTYPVILTFGRVDRIDYSDVKKTMPYLVYTISLASDPEEVLVTNHFRPKDVNGKVGRWNKNRGPNYDEDGIIQEYVDALGKNTRLTRKVVLAVRDRESLDERDPALSDFLQKIQDWKYDREKELELNSLIMQHIPMRSIQLDEPGYEGSYPIGFSFVADTIYPQIALKHQLAPDYGKGFSFAAIPVTPQTSNIQQLNEAVDQSLQENSDRIKTEYLKYLQSFAFSEEAAKETSQQLEPIARMIKDKSIELGVIRAELMRRQFIRPRKSKKTVGPGMVPQGGFKLIIDDKAIRNATFERGNSPEYFWAAIAYNLMRIKHNNIGFMPIFLDDAYRKVAEIVKRYGYDISAREVASYIDAAARAVYNDLTGKTYQSWDERWNEFYSGNSSTSPAEETFYTQVPHGWKTMCNEEGLTGSSENVKKEFRALSLKYHPDTCEGDATECTAKFVMLKSLYDLLPQNLKQASNWYQKIKFSSL